MADRATNCVIGALVADAAALGLHWIYDPARIREVAGQQPEFVEPELANYRRTTAYFAHKTKSAGDSSHYGEQLLVMLRSLAATGGAVFDAVDYERRFVDSFGPGGSWVGYVDYPTRETLRNIDLAERDALTASRRFDLGEFEADRALMEAKVMASVTRGWRDDKLDEAMLKAVRITHGENAALIEAGQAMARAVVEARAGSHGADDEQLPAFSKLPPLVARYAGSAALEEVVEEAVRVTNDNDAAVAWSIAAARLIEAAVLGAPVRKAAEEAARIDDRLAAALAFSGDAAEHFGRACPLEQSAPLIMSLLKNTAGFVDGARANILAGGDSAGRAIVLGAVLGAAYGVPETWCKRTRCLGEAERLLKSAP